MKFRPLHDRVVVKPTEQEDKTEGGIIIPDTAKEKPQEGEVVAVGPGRSRRGRQGHPLDVKAGDRVLFGKWSGTEVKLDGEDLMIMKESDIMGVIDRERQRQSQRYRRSETWLPRKSRFRYRRARADAARRRHSRQRGQGDARARRAATSSSTSRSARRASPRTA